jgi:hypothetical protein
MALLHRYKTVQIQLRMNVSADGELPCTSFAAIAAIDKRSGHP